MGWLAKLGLEKRPDGNDADAIRRIADELDKLDENRARYLAAFAFVLSRVAGADHEITPEEIAAMERLVAEKGHLPAEQAVMTVQLAKTQQRLFGGTDDFLVTRELNQQLPYEEKLAIIDCLFAVSASDQRILTSEDNEIMKIARELRVEHADVIRCRRPYLDHLESRRGLGTGG